MYIHTVQHQEHMQTPHNRTSYYKGLHSDGLGTNSHPLQDAQCPHTTVDHYGDGEKMHEWTALSAFTLASTACHTYFNTFPSLCPFPSLPPFLPPPSPSLLLFLLPSLPSRSLPACSLLPSVSPPSLPPSLPPSPLPHLPPFLPRL